MTAAFLPVIISVAVLDPNTGNPQTIDSWSYDEAGLINNATELWVDDMDIWFHDSFSNSYHIFNVTETFPVS